MTNLISVILLSVLPLTSLAKNSCATAKVTLVNNSKINTKITHIDHQQIESLDKYLFSTGSYLFRGFIIKESKKTSFSFESVLTEGFHYKLTIIPPNGNKNTFKFKQTQMEIPNCPLIIPPVENTKDNITNFGSSTNLPFELNYRLDDLILDLINHYKNQGITQPPIINLAQRNSYYFGASFARNSPLNEGILVNNIRKNSFAGSLGLKENDKIINFNQIDFSDFNSSKLAIKALSDEMNKLTNKQIVTIILRRDGKKKVITQSFKRINLPSLRLKIQPQQERYYES